MQKKSTKEILRKQNMLLINQINAQDILSKVWKSLNIPGYPTKWEIGNPKTDSRTWSREKLPLIELIDRSKIITSIFISDAARL
jgi:hypothetical protein